MADRAAGGTVIDLPIVDRVAALAQLGLSDAERQQLVHDLGAILGFVEQLRDLGPRLEALGEPERPGARALRLRPDVAGPSLPRELVLANVPDQAGGFVRVPAILE